MFETAELEREEEHKTWEEIYEIIWEDLYVD